MFLNQEDYKTLIKDPILAKVVESNDSIREEAEEMAQSEMSSFLNGDFDVESIFGETGADRNPVVIMYLLDMTLYHLHARLAHVQMPKIREERYKRAISWLEMVNAGKLTPDLPLKATEDQATGLRFRSNAKFGHQF